MEAIHAKIKNRVFWDDPDNGHGSGPGTIVEIHSDGEPVDDATIITVAKDLGGETETTIDELELLTDSLEQQINRTIKREKCEFVKSSDLFAGFDDLHNEFNDSEPDFSWGDNDHSLVTLDALLDDMDNNDVSVPAVFRYHCNQLGLQTYVDLES